MKRNTTKKREFYVVQFIELPFEGIDDYVCVPYTWLIVHRAMDQKAAVAYPKAEDPFDTRDRVKRKEGFSDEWRFYMAVVKYESDSYSDAEYWIATRNDYGPLVKEEPEIKHAPPRFTLNKKLRSANQSHSSKSNDNLQQPLPRKSSKRPSLAEPKEQLDEKRLKLGEAAQPSSTVAKPRCSKREQSIIIQHNRSMESAHKKVAAAASNGESSSSQHIDENFQPLPMQEQQELSMPPLDMDIPTVVKDSNGEVHVNRIMNKQLPSVQVSQFAQQPEPVGEPQISYAPSMTSNRQEHRTDHNLNNEPASHHLINSLKMSNHLYSHMNGARRLVPIQKPIEKRLLPMNIPRNMTTAAQNPSNLMDQTASTRSVGEQSSVVTHNQSQNSQVREMLVGNSRDQKVPTGQNMTAVGQRNVFQNVTKKREFYVVQFIELPFEGIDDYVCVPYTWLIVHRAMDQKAAVAYPKDEDPFDTRDRVKRKEGFSDEWRFYMAVVKYESDSYSDAECWIATRNDYGPLVKEEPEITHAPPRFTLNKKLRSANMTTAVQNPSNLMDQTASTRSVGEQSSVVTHNQSQNSQVREMLIGNSRDQTVPTGQNMTAVGQRNVFQNVTNVTSAFENFPSSSHERSSFARQLDRHQRSLAPEQYLKRSHQNQYLPTNQNNFEQQVIRGSTDSYSYDHRPMRISSDRQNLSHSVDPLYEKTSELSQERQSQLNQQDSQRQQQRPKICIGISMKRKNKNHMPTLQGVTKKMPQPILSRVLTAVQEALSTTRYDYLIEPQLQASESVLCNENHLNVMDKACQTEECIVKETMSPYRTVISDSDAVMDHEEISNLHMSPRDERHFETANNFYRSGTASGRTVIDRPSDAQNSTSANQRPSRLVLERQMLEHFSTLFTQMGTTLRYTCDMYNNLRSLILETAETYKQMLRSVEQFNTLGK